MKHRTKAYLTILGIVSIALLSAWTAPGKPLAIPDVDEVYPLVPNWRESRILHFGDSHVSAGFKSTLAQHFRSAGARFKQESWVGSRSRSWISSGRLKKLIASFRPNVVVITLGTNEMKNHRPERNRSWIRAIVDRMNGASCYWLGPPPLIEDVAGYNEMLKKNIAPCRYFDSRSLNITPREDGKFHLTREEGNEWAHRVWRWMNGD